MQNLKTDRSGFYEVPGFEGYLWVSHFGEVMGRSGKILKGHENKEGYIRIETRCRKTGRRFREYAHRLVLFAFKGRPFGMEGNHKDRNRKNNHINNLEWVDKFTNLSYRKWNNPRC